MEKYDTIIVGAGPAGLRTARVLAEAGRNTLVLEKNRTIGQTICAGGLTIRDMDFIPKNIIDSEFNYMLLHTAKGRYLCPAEPEKIMGTRGRQQASLLLRCLPEKPV